METELTKADLDSLRRCLSGLTYDELRDLLKRLYESAKIESQTGRHANRRPYTQKDFAKMNLARKELQRGK